MHDKVLVTDFDGTMTRHDFYRLAIERLIPPDCPNYWEDYRCGKLTHFDALAAYFRMVRQDKADVLAVVHDMQLDPQLSPSVKALEQQGWHIVVTSAGCQWYIDYLLSRAGIRLEIHANPGEFDSATGLSMTRPKNSEFASYEIGVNKAAVVEHWCGRSKTVAFAGDGYPDADAAKVVPERLRFARADLAEQLTSEGLSFRPFSVWSDIATALLND